MLKAPNSFTRRGQGGAAIVWHFRGSVRRRYETSICAPGGLRVRVVLRDARLSRECSTSISVDIGVSSLSYLKALPTKGAASRSVDSGSRDLTTRRSVPGDLDGLGFIEAQSPLPQMELIPTWRAITPGYYHRACRCSGASPLLGLLTIVS